jgi:uncharacterized protein
MKFVIVIAMFLLSAASSSFAAGFDCRKASSPDEKAICADPVLSAQDDLVNAAYAAAQRTQGSVVRPVARGLLAERRECGGNSSCIDKLQMKSLQLYKELAAEGSSNSSPTGVEKVPYGSRAGMEVTVVSKSGLNTMEAVIKVRHTRQDAEVYCREYVLKVSESCIQGALAFNVGTEMTAQCPVGWFTTLDGRTLTWAGLSSSIKTQNNYPEHIIIDPETKQALDGSSASGYDVALAQFSALCPQRASSGQ